MVCMLCRCNPSPYDNFFHTSTVDMLLSTDLKVIIYSGQLDLIVDTMGNTYLYICNSFIMIIRYSGLDRET